MSDQQSPTRERSGPADTIAGLMAAAAIFAGLIAVAYRPVRVGVPAVVLALVASGMGGSHSRLASAAVVVSGGCWLTGMIVAIITSHPLW